MARRTRTSFDKYLAQRIRDPHFKEMFREASAQIRAVDDFVRAIDDARIRLGMTKTELARRIGAKPEAVRRLLTADRVNPTLTTLLVLARALGLRLDLTAARGSKSAA